MTATLYHTLLTVVNKNTFVILTNTELFFLYFYRDKNTPLAFYKTQEGHHFYNIMTLYFHLL